MFKICPWNVQYMPLICPRYALQMNILMYAEVCPRYA